MTSSADGVVIIQTSSESVPSTPSWFGEVTLLLRYLREHAIVQHVQDHRIYNQWPEFFHEIQC